MGIVGLRRQDMRGAKGQVAENRDRGRMTEVGRQRTEDRHEFGSRTRRRPKRMGLCRGKHAEVGNLSIGPSVTAEKGWQITETFDFGPEPQKFLFLIT